MGTTENLIQMGIEEKKPISVLLQETLGEVNFICEGGCPNSKYYDSDWKRAETFTKCIALIRDYAKELENTSKR